MIHMLKERAGVLVTTRCLTVLKLKSGQRLSDIEVTGREHLITCPNCHLPTKGTTCAE